MIEYEYFSQVKIPVGCYSAIRVDGHCFHRVTKELQFKVPFDYDFRSILMECAKSLMKENIFDILLAYIQSDEISFIVSKDTIIFNRRIEKFNSLTASSISGTFEKKIKNTLSEPIRFDSRVIILPTVLLIFDYLKVRQQNSLTNCLYSYCFWKLRGKGLTASQATRKLKDMKNVQKQELLLTEFNIDFNNLPSWEKLGSFLYFKSKQYAGENKLTKEPITYTRREIVTEELDLFRDWQSVELLLRKVIEVKEGREN